MILMRKNVRTARAPIILGCLGFMLCGITQPADAQEQSAPPVALTGNLLGHDLPQREHVDPIHLLVRLGTQIHETELDCSHFVQYVYEQAGLDYAYAPSRILYAGQSGLLRVFHPKMGDLVVWPGHVGIVVNPRQKSFLSALNSGVKISSYASSYWKKRGNPRFFRYLNSNMAARQPRTKIASNHSQRPATDSE